MAEHRKDNTDYNSRMLFGVRVSPELETLKPTPSRFRVCRVGQSAQQGAVRFRFESR